MLFASVYPASDILKMAEDKGVELELIPIAYDAMVFFTNNDNPISGLTKEQISNIYVNNSSKYELLDLKEKYQDCMTNGIYENALKINPYTFGIFKKLN